MSADDLLLVLAVYRQCKADAAFLRERWGKHLEEPHVWRPGTGVVDRRQSQLALD